MKAMKKIIIVVAIVFILFTAGCNKEQSNKRECDQWDWGCICANIDDEITCNKYSDCTWTNFHSNEFYCMERFCMDYNKTECKLHDRCMWVFDKNGGYPYCEGAQYFDETRHAIINETA